MSLESTTRWTETRPGRLLLFLGIVWSVSGAFLALQTGLPSLLYWAMDQYSILPERLSSEEEIAARCAALDDAKAGASPSAEAARLQHARYAAFRMGRGFGVSAAARFSGLADPGLQEVREFAMVLGVPPPELPRIRHEVNALIEFSDHMANDPQCTAYRLASRYAPAHAHAYQFGVFIGYAALSCLNGACGAHEMEIRRHGKAAGVPESIWLTMARGSLAEIPGASVKEKIFRVLASLDQHFRARD